MFVNSGIRYDLASLDDEFVEELAEHHVQGQLSVAPEHAGETALQQMKKPAIPLLHGVHGAVPRGQPGAGQGAVPRALFPVRPPRSRAAGVHRARAVHEEAQAAPPSGPDVHADPRRRSRRPRTTRGSIPYTRKPVYVAKGRKERSRQRALLFYWKREEQPHVREALIQLGPQGSHRARPPRAGSARPGVRRLAKRQVAQGAWRPRGPGTTP